LFPLAPLTFFTVMGIREIGQLLTHSGLPWSWGWIGRWVLTCPAGHAILHSAEPRFYNKNFSPTFVFWDRLFGTYAA